MKYVHFFVGDSFFSCSHTAGFYAHGIGEKKLLFMSGKGSFNAGSGAVNSKTKAQEEAEKKEKKRVAQEQEKIQDLSQKIISGRATDRQKSELRKFSPVQIKNAMDDNADKVLLILNGSEEQDINDAVDRLYRGLNLSDDFETFCSIAPFSALSYLKGRNRSRYLTIFARITSNSSRMKSPQAFLLAKRIDKDADKIKSLGQKEYRIIMSFRDDIMNARAFFKLAKEEDKTRDAITHGTAEVRRNFYEQKTDDLSLDDRERNMADIVSKTLGGDVAKRAMEAVHKTHSTEQEKTKAFFDVIETERQKMLLDSRKMTLPEIKNHVTSSYRLRSFLIQESNFSDAEKEQLIINLGDQYRPLIEKLLSLSTGDDLKYAKRLKEMGFLTDQDLRDINEIEEFRKDMVVDVWDLSEQFYEVSSAIFQEKSSIQTLNLADQSNAIEGAIEKFSSSNSSFPIEKTKLKRFFTTDEGIRPLDFLEVQEFGKKYSLLHKKSMSPVDEIIISPEIVENIGVSKFTLDALYTGGHKPSKEVIAFYRPRSAPRYITESKDVLKDLISIESKINFHLEFELSLDAPEQKQTSALNAKINDQYQKAFDTNVVHDALKNMEMDIHDWSTTLGEVIRGRTDENAQNAARAIQESQQFMADVKANATPDKIASAKTKVDAFLSDYTERHGGEIPVNKKHYLSHAFDHFDLRKAAENAQQKRLELQSYIQSGDVDDYLSKYFAGPTVFKPATLVSSDHRLEWEKNISKLVPKIIFAIKNRQNLPEGFLYTKKPDGMNLFERVSTEDWNTVRSGGKSFRDLSDTGFLFDTQTNTIYLEEHHYDALESGRAEFETDFSGLGHELSHLVFKFSNAEKSFAGELEKHASPDGNAENLLQYSEKQLENIFGNTQSAASNLEELLVSGVVGGNSNMHLQGLLNTIKGTIGEDRFDDLFEQSAQEFSKNFKTLQNSKNDQSNPLLESLAGQSTGDAIAMAPVSDIIDDPKLIQSLYTQIQQAQKGTKEKLESLIKNSKVSKAVDYAKQLLEHMNNQLEDFLDSPTETLAKDLIDDNDAKLGQLRGDVDKLTQQASEQSEESGNYIQELWRNTNVLSMRDMTRMWETFTEYVKRRHEVRSKRRGGEVGRDLFTGINSKLANEYDKEQEDAERQEVDKYKEALDNKDAWEIYDFIDKSNNVDEIKGAMRTLASKGRLDWNKQEIWDALTRLGGGVTFYPSDRFNFPLRNSKLQKAMTRIWDADEYREMETDNQSNIDSNIQKYEKEAGTYVNQLGPQLNRMLEDSSNGVAIDPNRYEAFVRHLHKAGKGEAEMVIYFTIAGIAAEIMTPERGMSINEELTNEYPQIQFIEQMNPDLHMYKTWLTEIIGQQKMHKKEYSYPSDNRVINDWMNKNVMNKELVTERVMGNLTSGDKWDHDHARFIGSIGNTEGAIGITGTATGGNARFKTSMYPNLIVGILQHATSISRQADSIPKSELRKTFARQAGYFANLDGILNSRVFSDERKVRISDSELNTVPREARGGIYGKLSAREFMERNRTIYGAIPALKPLLQGIIFNPRYSGKDGEKAAFEKWTALKDEAGYADILAKLGKSEPSDTKELFGNVHAFIDYYLDPDPTTGIGEPLATQNLNAMVAAGQKVYAHDHKN